jgi:hypothetical protein
MDALYRNTDTEMQDRSAATLELFIEVTVTEDVVWDVTSSNTDKFVVFAPFTPSVIPNVA